MPSTILSDNGVTSGTSGIKTTGSNDGTLALQTTTAGGAATTALSISTSQVVTLTNALAEASGGTGTNTGYYGFKNRIINGAMVFDQRNAGASITPVNDQYSLDRWGFPLSQASKLTVQQNAGAVTPPVGFSNYLGVTSSSAYSITSTDYFVINQNIEGFNTSDFAFGTANAKTITLSFQVYSSLTGTFGGSLRNSAGSRSYPFTYTISSANTWTSISVTIAGDTSGTWVGATNGIGLRVAFSLGVGTTYSGTAGAWAGTNYLSATGATSVVGTNGATFYITGVQLEKGSTATSFDYRPYGTELQLCMRYFQLMGSGGACGTAESTTRASMTYVFPVPMRASATGTLNASNGTLNQPQGGPNAITSTNNFFFAGASGTQTSGGWLVFDDPSSIWTTGRVIISNGSQGMVQFSAEL